MESYPFTSNVTYDENGLPHYDRAVDSAFLRKVFAMYFSDGVFYAPASAMQVAADAGMSVTVQPGAVHIRGAMGIEESERTLVVQAAETLDRIDTVVARLDLGSGVNGIDLYVVKGQSAVSPQPPELTRNNQIWELGLANLFIAKNTAVITQQRITDTRLDSSRCGVVAQTIAPLDTSPYFSQLQAMIEELTEHYTGSFADWFAEIKDQLSSDAAGNLQNQCTELAEQLSLLELSLTADGAGAHNSIYRGKNLGAGPTPEQYAVIADGTFKDLYIGDYWVKGSMAYRIACFDYALNSGDTACTQHHVLIVPDKVFYTHVMNDSNTTAGGYVGSKMYTEGLTSAKAAIKADFAGHVLKHREYFINAVTDGHPAGGAWLDSEVDLMNENMVYGTNIFLPRANGSEVYANHTIGKGRLPLFALRHDLIIVSNRKPWWLRDAVSGSVFALVGGDGSASTYNASHAHGVRPAFCIF